MKNAPDYGLDAPGLVRGFIGGGLALIVVGAFTGTSFVYPGVSILVTGCLMVLYSYVLKKRSRDQLIASLKLVGHETVLDLGCGRGLLLIGAAKALPRGKAIGLDLWSQRDLSSNSKEATLRNAELEGVKARVQVIDGDMRQIPLADASVDVVIASFAIHNIPNKEGRHQAVADAARVLRSGGRVALLDFKSTADYEATLRQLGFRNLRRPYSYFCFPPSRIVYGEKP